MVWVTLTALGVGGATITGAIIGYFLRDTARRYGHFISAFAAGVMLAAAIVGLILPSLEHSTGGNALITVAGIISGVAFIQLLDHLLVPHLHKLSGPGISKDPHSRIYLFIAAIAIHNFPEGVAAGISFGTENTAEAMGIAGGIALHNLPEGMVIISPMLAAGIPTRRTMLCAMSTGLMEVIGTFVGYFAVTLATAILPFGLAFAGGTMLYVILDDMIPEGTAGIYSLLAGFCAMLIMNTVLL